MDFIMLHLISILVVLNGSAVVQSAGFLTEITFKNGHFILYVNVFGQCCEMTRWVRS